MAEVDKSSVDTTMANMMVAFALNTHYQDIMSRLMKERNIFTCGDLFKQLLEEASVLEDSGK